MNVGGETIQISLGPAANAVTSHLCNLQGLAATTNTDNVGNDEASSPLCDPYVTHAVHKETYVPRVLFVDGKNCFEPWPAVTHDTSVPSTSTYGTTPDTPLDAWRGNVEVHHCISSLSTNSQQPNDGRNFNQSINSNNHNNAFADSSNERWKQVSNEQRDAFYQYQYNASMLYSTSSTNVNSRYHSSHYSRISSQFVHSRSSVLHSDAGGRCMVWDDDEEEEEEEDEYSRQRRLDQERQRRNRQEHETLDQMSNAWNAFMGQASTTSIQKNDDGDKDLAKKSPLQENNESSSSSTSTSKEKGLTTEKERRSVLQSLQWMNYFMPPHPVNNMYAAQLPFDRLANSAIADANTQKKRERQTMLYSFYGGEHPSSSSSSFCAAGSMSDGLSTDWRENVLSDKIRRWMEDCDSVRAFQVSVDSDLNFFGGLATSVLQELSDECKSAAKFSIMVGDGDTFSTTPTQETEEDQSYWRSENKVVQVFRSDLNSGLSLHGIAENSDLALPLSLSKCWQNLQHSKHNEMRNLFEASAVGALALEAVTLPYRIAGGLQRNQCKIGLNSGFFQGSGQSDGEDTYPTAQKLTFHEFISALKPSNRHIMTELSGFLQPKLSPFEMHQRLMQGTSIERRQLEEERNRNRNSYYRRSRGRDIEPGLWTEDGSSGGIMSTLSPLDPTSRSLHQHFALASSYRPLRSSVGDVVSTYNTALMEGMGIRYRPQTSFATVAAHSFDSFVGSGGSYWGSILEHKKHPVQILTLLGNSTRIHPHLKATALGLKNALSRKYAGYLTRDNMSGLAPESEDCGDALEGCLSLRDIYENPMDYDDEDEGIYFEDNCD